MSDRVGSWRELLGCQAQSELSVRDFCDLEGVSTASFYSWRRRLADRVKESPAFVPLKITRPETRACLEIVLSDAMTIRVPEGTRQATQECGGYHFPAKWSQWQWPAISVVLFSALRVRNGLISRGRNGVQ